MQQQIFNFSENQYPSYASFLGEANQELLFSLEQHQSNLTYIWGDKGVGKSHLLKAWVSHALAQGLSALCLDIQSSVLLDKIQDNVVDCLAIDDVHLFDRNQQIKLLDIFNDIHNKQSCLLVSSYLPSLQLDILPDLRTRLGLCLSYQIYPLTDREKEKAIKDFAEAKQIYLEADVIRFILIHGERDLTSLLIMIEKLDQYAVEKKRKITIPLLKELMSGEDDE